MGKTRTRDRQATMWVATADLPQRAGHPFYERLNRVLDDAGFDTFVEEQCARFYAATVGRPSLAPGRSCRLLLLGYFEGLDSERAIAWRAADSLSIRAFLDVDVHEAPPDHSTVSRTRRLIDLETHEAVFTWVLQRLADAQLVRGHTIGIDATTLEANAAMRSIVRRDSSEAYAAWLTRLAEASGIATPTRAELARFDRTRTKKGSNDDWTHPQDPDAKITKMKDGLGEDLQGDLAVELRVGGLPDLAHPAFPEEGGDVVVPEAGAGGQGHGSVGDEYRAILRRKQSTAPPPGAEMPREGARTLARINYPAYWSSAVAAHRHVIGRRPRTRAARCPPCSPGCCSRS